MSTRPAAKAGSWYDADPKVLRAQLVDFMGRVPSSIEHKSLPVREARIVIAPHAGYDYSGPCAAWAYKTLDLSRAKRVFVLGPSHTYGFSGAAATTFDSYATPFGDLTIDRATANNVKNAAGMNDIPRRNEVDEHSLEMHLPYLYLRLEETFGSKDRFPPIVPILIGSNNGRGEAKIGRALLPYLQDPENAFVISSDFCHWGDRNFGYSPYSPTCSTRDLTGLSRHDPKPTGPPIHETIRVIDEAAMDAVKSGNHEAFLSNLRDTGNTVCGRHPIGVMMAALELLRRESGNEDKGFFQVVQYNRSSLVDSPRDSSVSYVSAYAVA